MKNKLFLGAALLLYFMFSFKHVECQSDTLKRYDIVIHEIMADPTPEVGLPAAEYVELHNRTSHRCRLDGWKLKIGNTVKQLPVMELDSCGYMVLVASKYEDEMSAFTAEIATLSSLSLTDAGQTLILYNASGEVIHAVSYKKQWHSEPIKREGGWSLEMLDCSQPWRGADNWNSSTSLLGGTPGAPNAAHTSLSEDELPVIERVTMLDSHTVRLFFSTPVCPQLPLSPTLFTITPDIAIDSVREVPPYFRALDLTLASVPRRGRLYTLGLAGELCDCARHAMKQGSSIVFGLSEKPARGDLVLNEILTHPFDGTDADFIEFFNKSSHIIDLKDIKIGSGGDSIPQKSVTAVPDGFQLLPSQYCALCKNKSLTLAQYNPLNPLALVDCDSLPSYNNGEGVVYLTNKSLQQIDRLHYTEDMHYPKLITTEGVSLERLSAERPTQDPNNWCSAAATVGFATPGYANSQQGQPDTDEQLSIQPEVISPNNDGFQDFAEISLLFDEPENRVSVQIFNHQGHIVRHLANNELCGTEALFRWDGLDDKGNRLPSGMYVVQIQYWNMDGHSKRYRKVVSIAGW